VYLQPENLLFAKKCEELDKFVKEEWNMKLIDFGLAGKSHPEPLKTPCGTPNYVAPEVLRRHKYNYQVDMWSAGVILYIMCVSTPFLGHLSMLFTSSSRVSFPRLLRAVLDQGSATVITHMTPQVAGLCASASSLPSRVSLEGSAPCAHTYHLTSGWALRAGRQAL